MDFQKVLWLNNGDASNVDLFLKEFKKQIAYKLQTNFPHAYVLVDPKDYEHALEVSANIKKEIPLRFSKEININGQERPIGSVSLFALALSSKLKGLNLGEISCFISEKDAELKQLKHDAVMLYGNLWGKMPYHLDSYFENLAASLGKDVKSLYLGLNTDHNAVEVSVVDNIANQEKLQSIASAYVLNNLPALDCKEIENVIWLTPTGEFKNTLVETDVPELTLKK